MSNAMEDLEKLEEMIKNAKKEVEKNEEKRKKDLEDAKNSIRECLDDDIECLSFITNQRTIMTGSGKELLVLLTCFIGNILEELPLDAIVIALLTATCSKNDGTTDFDKDKINELLESIKKIM